VPRWAILLPRLTGLFDMVRCTSNRLEFLAQVITAQRWFGLISNPG